MTVCDRLQHVCKLVHDMSVIDGVTSSTLIQLFVASLFKIEEYCYISFSCAFVLFAGRRDPSHLLATHYGSGLLDMYVRNGKHH